VYGPLLLISLFYQEVQPKSAFMTEQLLAPMGSDSLVPLVFAGKLTDRIGPKLIILVGLMITVLGTLPFVFANTDTREWLLAAGLFVRGFGLTPVNIAVMVGAYQAVTEEELPKVSSIVRIIQQVGGTFGTVVLIVILTHALLTHSSHSQALNVAF
jgi:MFS family permease